MPVSCTPLAPTQRRFLSLRGACIFKRQSRTTSVYHRCVECRGPYLSGDGPAAPAPTRCSSQSRPGRKPATGNSSTPRSNSNCSVTARVLAGDLINLNLNRGRLEEALTLADQKADYTRRAGYGPWSQLGDPVQRLQILYRQGHTKQVLDTGQELREQMATLHDPPADNEKVNPFNVRELLLKTMVLAARVGSMMEAKSAGWRDAPVMSRELRILVRRRCRVRPIPAGSAPSGRTRSSSRRRVPGPLARCPQCSDRRCPSAACPPPPGLVLRRRPALSPLACVLLHLRARTPPRRAALCRGDRLELVADLGRDLPFDLRELSPRLRVAAARASSTPRLLLSRLCLPESAGR